ncbi:MAG: hypothetical protein JST39_23380, partial [Bacteroidetes bacterium]|nr:hypothetical protein [Bacteroidota bacterium]
IQSTRNALQLPSTQPYLSFTDSAGKPAWIPYQYRISVLDSLPAGRFYDWRFYPLQEQALSDNRSRDELFQGSVNLKYDLPFHLQADLLYKYSYSVYEHLTTYAAASYFTRDLVNRFMRFDGSNRIPVVPYGSILDVQRMTGSTIDYRAQIHAHYLWGAFEFQGVAGLEQHGQDLQISAARLYGYDLQTSQRSLPTQPIATNPNGPNAPIPYPDTQWDSANHFRGYYVSGMLCYKDRLSFSISARKDQSNFFAYTPNHRAMPMLSAGVAWQAAPLLRFRLSFGGTGNSVYAGVSGTAVQPVAAVSSAPLFTIARPADEQQQWEQRTMINTGADIGKAQHRVQGSINFYLSRTDHVLQERNGDPNSGFPRRLDYSGVITGWGADLQLRADSIPLARPVCWDVQVAMGFNRNQLVSDPGITRTAWNYVNPSGWLPRQHDAPDALYAVRSARLDNAGNPVGRLNGQPSEDYDAILADTSKNAAVYVGPGIPVFRASVTTTVH